MKRHDLRRWWWIVGAATACGHIGLDFQDSKTGSVPGDGDGDSSSLGGETSVDTDVGDGDGTGGRSIGSGGDEAGGEGGADGSGGNDGPHGSSGGDPSTSSGGANGSGGVPATGGVDGSGGTDGSGGATPGGVCDVPAGHHFSFDTGASYSEDGPGMDVWGLDSEYTMNSGSMSWTGSTGHLEPGALKLNIVRPLLLPTDRQALFPRTTLARKNLQGKTIVAHIYVSSGLQTAAKIFVQSYDYYWAEGGLVPLEVGEWTCLQLELDAPAYADAGFDPDDIIAVGVEVARDAGSLILTPITAYLDDVSY